jgi:hypothetical protein
MDQIVYFTPGADRIDHGRIAAAAPSADVRALP